MDSMSTPLEAYLAHTCDRREIAPLQGQFPSGPSLIADTEAVALRCDVLEMTLFRLVKQDRDSYPMRSTELIRTGVRGTSWWTARLPVGTLAMDSTISVPSTTLPNTQ